MQSPSGAITDTYDYDAFGNLISSTGTTLNNYLFAGEQFDPALGIYYNRARYYDQRQGRFWTADRFEGDPQSPMSLHKYLYAGGNPIDRADPSGRSFLDTVFTYTAIAVQIAAIAVPVGAFVGAARVYYGGGSEDDMIAGAKSGEVSGGVFAALWAIEWLQPVLAAIGVAYGTNATAEDIRDQNYQMAVVDGSLLFASGYSLSFEPAAAPRTFSGRTAMEGDIANLLESRYSGYVENVNVNKFNSAGELVTEIDVETADAYIQIKGGTNFRRAALQITKTASPEANPYGKKIVSYAPKASRNQRIALKKAGATVVTNETELLKLLRPE